MCYHPTRILLITPPTPTHLQKTIPIYVLNLNFAVQKDSLPTSFLTPTRLHRQKRALRQLFVLKVATARNRGPPAAAEWAASPESRPLLRRQRHLNMCDLFFQKEENISVTCHHRFVTRVPILSSCRPGAQTQDVTHVMFVTLLRVRGS